ncbi:MAG TPA: phosphohistidine phosphatase SixA [Candidatus Paceibacterota bacterium]|nr:phosphohistidine phosphatase SixA [Verrucomicrobiota bacterium]HRY51715.1 phosphohistidine phosphatase SixA [Candidatus Paceibacterota bacterium]
MELYLLRHAQAVDPATKGFEIDGDRVLTPQGKTRAREVGRALKRLGLSFNGIVSSPYRRARQTARIVAKVLDAEDLLIVSNHLAPTGHAADLIAELNRHYTHLDRVLVVGHEPSLSQLASTLLTGNIRLPLDLKKAGLIRLEIDTLSHGQCAALEWLIPPRLLSVLARR